MTTKVPKKTYHNYKMAANLLLFSIFAKSMSRFATNDWDQPSLGLFLRCLDLAMFVGGIVYLFRGDVKSDQ